MSEYTNKELENLLGKAEELQWSYNLYKEDDGRTYAEMAKHSPLGVAIDMDIGYWNKN